MTDLLWNAARGLASLLSRLDRMISTKASLISSFVLLVFSFFSETELSKILDARFSNWAAVGSIVAGAFLLIAILLKNWQNWSESMQAISDGASIEMLVTGTENPFLFENTHARGPLHGEILHYKLFLRIQALRNLKLARARLMITGGDRSIDVEWEDFGGQLPKGHQATVCMATLRIESGGMIPCPETIPHTVISSTSVRLYGERTFRDTSASRQFEIEVAVRHASGEVRTRVLLWIWSNLPTPGKVISLQGRLRRTQLPLRQAEVVLATIEPDSVLRPD